MLTDDFYANLIPLENLLDITEPQKFVDVPKSWYVVITDITNSTQAIASGRYREVNLLGASSIVAILNAANRLELPFIFGGDGATIFIPASLLSAAKEALFAIQQLARSRFNLNIRIGVVPIRAILAAGYEVKIAKLKVSEHYYQAMVTGGGLTYASEFIKDYSIPDIYQLKRHKKIPKADFSGLECRWKDIPASHDEVVSLHVLAIAHHSDRVNQIYREVLEKILNVYGTKEDFNPVNLKNLNLSFKARKLAAEVKLRSPSRKAFSQQSYLWKIQFENLLGSLLMQFKAVMGGVNWGIYKRDLISATDCQKFDDMLRMILSGNAQQSATLMAYLDQRYRDGELVYGLHISDHVLMTCIVFERNGRQVHFVDGADGGFALASQALKERMLRKALNWKTFLKMIRAR
jgi:hypothetical protein